MERRWTRNEFRRVFSTSPLHDPFLPYGATDKAYLAWIDKCALDIGRTKRAVKRKVDMAITAKDHYVKKEFHMMNADDWDALKYACTFGYFGGTIKPTKSKARPRTVKVRSHTRSYTQRELNA